MRRDSRNGVLHGNSVDRITIHEHARNAVYPKMIGDTDKRGYEVEINKVELRSMFRGKSALLEIVMPRSLMPNALPATEAGYVKKVKD